MVVGVGAGGGRPRQRNGDRQCDAEHGGGDLGGTKGDHRHSSIQIYVRYTEPSRGIIGIRDAGGGPPRPGGRATPGRSAAPAPPAWCPRPPPGAGPRAGARGADAEDRPAGADGQDRPRRADRQDRSRRADRQQRPGNSIDSSDPADSTDPAHSTEPNEAPDATEPADRHDSTDHGAAHDRTDHRGADQAPRRIAATYLGPGGDGHAPRSSFRHLPSRSRSFVTIGRRGCLMHRRAASMARTLGVAQQRGPIRAGSRRMARRRPVCSGRLYPLRRCGVAAPSTSAVMSFAASDRPMPLVESERQVEKARAWRNAPPSSCRPRPRT